MSVLIRGMEMPKSCRDCGIEQEGFWCGALDGYQNTRCFTNERREDCPIVPVPPHGDLVDRREAIIDANERAYDFWLSDDEVNATIQFLNEQTAVIPAEEDTDFFTKGHLHLGYAEEGE